MDESPTEPRKIDVLVTLLKVYTPEQLAQIAEASLQIQRQNEEGQQADVIIRFKSGRPRWVGIGPIFVEMIRPGKE